MTIGCACGASLPCLGHWGPWLLVAMQTALKISGMQALRAVREDIQRTNALVAAEVERLRGPQVCVCVFVWQYIS